MPNIGGGIARYLAVVTGALIGLCTGFGANATAQASPAQQCDAAARQASTETGVPLEVLQAITRTETGRGQGAQMQPWPWTVNMEGTGVWFDTEAQAQGYVFRHFREGARSFDIGCFQINYKWHGQAFNSIEEMFDPLANARYAADFLSRLHAEHQDWTRAVGAYHSRTHQYATRYLERYAQVRQQMGAPDEGTGLQAASRYGYPLIRRGTAAPAAGSLFPQVQGSARSLFSATTGG